MDAPSNQSLLLSLEMGGANWPSSCRNGTCRTCIGKLDSGQVRYELEWPGLSGFGGQENRCALVHKKWHYPTLHSVSPMKGHAPFVTIVTH